MPADADQMAGVRIEVAEYAYGAGMSETSVEDARTVVTEACGNSIKHAYGDSPVGSLEVEAHTEDGELCLVVRDFGSGIGPRTGASPPSLHAGLSIIGALSNSFRLSSRRGGGTELEARLPLLGTA
ncbi:MAG TPA: ATP-binding protein [Solirubrobacterales bacterium]|nr:ATP-binding protein [Solirubrobacterales bacterium]